jgi:hypothetical protein
MKNENENSTARMMPPTTMTRITARCFLVRNIPKQGRIRKDRAVVVVVVVEIKKQKKTLQTF